MLEWKFQKEKGFKYLAINLFDESQTESQNNLDGKGSLEVI